MIIREKTDGSQVGYPEVRYEVFYCFIIVINLTRSPANYVEVNRDQRISLPHAPNANDFDRNWR